MRQCNIEKSYVDEDLAENDIGISVRFQKGMVWSITFRFLQKITCPYFFLALAESHMAVSVSFQQEMTWPLQPCFSRK